MDNFLPIGERLKEERLRLRFNQDDFSQEAGITRKTLFGYETGMRAPDAGSLAVWAKMGLDVAYVVTGNNKKQSAPVLTAEEQVVIDAYRKLPAEQQKQLMILALTGVDIKQDKEKKKNKKEHTRVDIKGDNISNSGNVNSFIDNSNIANNSINIGNNISGTKKGK